MTPNINEILGRPEFNASSKYGADMGRPSYTDGEPECLHLQRVRFVDGDYDNGGAYWGGGRGVEPLWCAFSTDATTNDVPIRVFVRAGDRSSAKTEVLALLPGTGWTFFN